MANKQPIQPNEVVLTAVRLSFPQLFVAKSIAGGDPTFGASFLLDKEADKEQILACRRAMTAAAKEKWPTKMPAGLTPDRLALKDGATKEYDGYGPTVMFVSANSKNPIPCVDLNPRVVITRETGSRLYAGCYVNAKVRFWAMDDPAHKEWGVRICAQLVAVQFVMDGEPFGEGVVKADEVFEDLSNGETGVDAFGTGGTSDQVGGGLLG